MAYKLYLTDSAGTHELPELEVPLTRVLNENMTTVQPLSGNVYDDYISTKRAYSHTWAFLSNDEYQMLEDIYERMKSEYTYPRLTVEGENISLMTVKFTLSSKNIISDCGEIADVTVGFQETRGLGS